MNRLPTPRNPGRHSARRPLGLPTRGKTALNRLRQVDVYVALAHPGVLSGASPLIVDLGFGAFPWTTLEMRARWASLNPALRVLGLEIDPERVAAAQPYAEPPGVRFAAGGFNVRDSLGGERARLIRCYNVLRQYEESAVTDALAAMSDALEPGGMLVEGTSTPSGRLVAFDVYRRDDGGNSLFHEALVFGTNFRSHVTPVDFQAILPKRLIHRTRDPGPSQFFAAWQRAFVLSRGARGIRAEWLAAARILAVAYSIDMRERIVRRGYLALRGPLG